MTIWASVLSDLPVLGRRLFINISALIISSLVLLLVPTNVCICLLVCFLVDLVSPPVASFERRFHFTLSQGQMMSSVSSLFIHTLLVYNSFQLFTSTGCWVLFIHWLDCTCIRTLAKSLEGWFSLSFEKICSSLGSGFSWNLQKKKNHCDFFEMAVLKVSLFFRTCLQQEWCFCCQSINKRKQIEIKLDK